jgi:hypothetical protein
MECILVAKAITANKIVNKYKKCFVILEDRRSVDRSVERRGRYMSIFKRKI